MTLHVNLTVFPIHLGSMAELTRGLISRSSADMVVSEEERKLRALREARRDTREVTSRSIMSQSHPFMHR